MSEEIIDESSEKKYYDNVSVAKRTKQVVYICDEEDKATMVEYFLTCSDKKQSTIVVKSKKRADELSIYLNSKDVKNIAVHGNHRKEQIDKGVSEFNAGNIALLITTDKILHSLELDSLQRVINYDLPSEHKDYFASLLLVDEVGESISFVSQEDEYYLATVELRQKSEIAQEFLDGFTSTCSDTKIHKIKDKKRKPRHRGRKLKRVREE